MAAVPVHYSPELAQLIFEKIASETTMRALEDMPGFPNRATLWKWADRYPDFQRALDRARQAAADAWSDEAVWIADNDNDPQKARNRIDVRKWLAGCIKPRAYGPKVDITVAERMLDSAELAKEARRRIQVMHNGTPALPAIYE